MKRIKMGWAALRNNKRSGVSLIIALCAVALLLGLSLSLVYSASLPMARANKKIERERAYQLAKSFAEVLDYELETYELEDASPSDSFYRYANKLLEGVYGEYDPDHPELTTYYYTSAEGDDNYGKMTVKLRKESTQGEEDTITGGVFPLEASGSRTQEIEKDSFIRYLFYVDVTATIEQKNVNDPIDGESCTYSTEYFRKDSFEPVYYWREENVAGRQRVYWNGGAWYVDSSYHTLKEPGTTEKESEVEGEEPIVEVNNVEIEYSYDTDHITYRRYIPTYLEGGGS